MSDTLKQIKELAMWMMASDGMPSLVINAPQESEGRWRVYPSGHRAIGVGRTLEDAMANAHSWWLKIHGRPNDA